MDDKKAGSDTSSLYVELSKLQQGQNFEKALKVCNKILNLSPADETAFHCKMVCLIQLGKFDDALRQIRDTHFKVELAFEEAYCLYRLNQTEESLQVISRVKNPDMKHKELKAQILYRLERCEESYAVYRDILKNTCDDEFEVERLTNVAAVSVSLKKDLSNDVGSEEGSYEISYNTACLLLSQGKWKEAELLLIKAEATCKAALQDDEGYDAEDLERETAIIRVQMAYAIQMQGREKEAQAIYTAVLKSKPDDVAVLAVASNNIITLNRDQNIFDSKKRIKVATAEEVDGKLTSQHRRTIAKNNALFAMYTNQVDLCKTLVHEWAGKFKDVSVEEQNLIVAGVLARSGKSEEAVALLLQASAKDSDLEKRLIAAQIFLEKGEVNSAINLLNELPVAIKFRTGILSTLVALHLAADNRAGAASLLKEAVEYNAKLPNANQADMKTVWKKTAEFHLRGDDPRVAAQCLEQLLVHNPHDVQTLANLVLAYARFDLKKALETSKKLPALSYSTVDVAVLESSSFLGAKIAKKPVKDASALPSPKTTTPGTDINKKKTKKKRKKRLPKNYNPNVDPDPERWIPRRERTAFRKIRKDRRKGHDKFTGAQGTAAGQADMFDYSGKKATTNFGASPKSPIVDQPGPRQQQRKPQQKGKKKGKRF